MPGEEIFDRTPQVNADPRPAYPMGLSRIDHHFEWDRARFKGWAEGVAARHGYGVTRHDIGETHPALGGASQMAVFARLG